MTDESKSPNTDDSEVIDESSEVLEENDSADAGSEENTGPENTGPENTGPENTGPENTGTENTAQGTETAEATTESTGEVFLDSDDDDDDAPSGDIEMDWYILKVAFNREDSIADALRKKIAMEGMEEYFGEVVVPSEDIATFTRDGKKRITKRKLLPGYIMARMAINDDTWFLVRETGGISDFTGSAGKPMPMDPADVDRFINRPIAEDEEEAPIKTAIPFKVGDRVRVKEGNFENQEGDVDAVDEANGRITVIINIFGRSVPMELDHWQVEPV
ncbi:transcription termination/antitermination protein NusG [Stieleria sp. ICT_E10.1]|uniref:transcription termination/antitermination protein NusG n=1 Tax=Stieleria sedimenti TaxID=2976331 RepID=UPI0021808F70|nr:transcription termination/antitermination protein NusG [Stieleria sedimenti]MCS7465321.1 transcription termination/antitermination protein NusG [Stieleria sedimenti]